MCLMIFIFVLQYTLLLLSQYRDVVQALKRGDLRLLRHALQEHEDRYVLFHFYKLGGERISGDWRLSSLFLSVS